MSKTTTPQFSVVSDGTPQGTEVFFNGQKVKGVQFLEVGPISLDSLPTLTITVNQVALGRADK